MMPYSAKLFYTKHSIIKPLVFNSTHLSENRYTLIAFTQLWLDLSTSELVQVQFCGIASFL